MGSSDALYSSSHAFERVVFILTCFWGRAGEETDLDATDALFDKVGVDFELVGVAWTGEGRLASLRETVLGEMGENGSTKKNKQKIHVYKYDVYILLCPTCLYLLFRYKAVAI